MSNFAKRARELSPAEKRALLEQALHKQAKTSRAFPLSYAQERLWFLDQWEPQSSARNIFSILQLQGSLQVRALGCSLTEIMRRHEVLRTMFLTIEGQPAQVIVPGLQVFMPMVDLCGISAEEQAELVQRLAQQEELRPFDLRRAPLLRTMLLRLHETEHIFLLTMHHIISDGWSVSIFNRELVVLYEAFSQGGPSPLPELPIQYTDYARWQRQQLQGEVLQQHLAYWRQQLHGAPPFLVLPTDRPRPAVQTFAGATHYHVLLADQYAELQAFSRHEGVTPFTTLLAVFQILLAFYSQQEDISVGTYIAGRTNVQTEQLIGFFINNLVLRTDLSGDPPFRTLLQRVSRMAQEAYEHQDVPFERLIQELQPERNPSYTPLFQVMLIYQNMPAHELTLPGITIRSLDIERMRSNFDLSLWVGEASENRLIISFEYNPNLFNTMTIERMAEHFQLLLHTILLAPEQRLSELSLFSEADFRALQQLNASEADLTSSISLEHLFETQVACISDSIAAVFEDHQLTYAELDRRAEQLAKALQSRGVGPEVPVGLCLERSLEMVIALLGVLKAGGAYVPLDPTYPIERLTFMQQQTHLLLLLTQGTLASRLSLLQVPLLCIDTDWPAIDLARRSLQRFSHRASHLAYVIYTSGSTGEPKGVAVEQHSLVNFTQTAAHIFEIKPGDRVLQFASLSFDASAEEIYPCLTHGGTLVLRTETMIQSPAYFMQTCQRWGVTTLDLPTAYWHELAIALEREKLVFPSYLRLIIIGGEHALAERLADWQRNGGAQIKLVNTYGPTETTVAASAHLVRAREPQEPDEASIIGQAITNVQLYVLDRHRRRLPIGISGELFIGGQGLARGYLHRPELTAERFVPDPFSDRPGARLYRTGDLVRLLSDGMLEYRGRVDRQVKLRGYRIELGEIETALAQHPGVREAAVLLREDVIGEKMLVAYVVSEPAQRATSGDLRNFLQQHLPGYMLPASFVQMESMPQTPNGKLDRRALPAPHTLSREREHIWELPQTPTEELLADLWKQVLHREQVGRHDHFFASGGHSLLATRLVARVREIFEIELPLRTIFESPVLSALAKEIEIARNDQQLLQMPPLRPRATQEELSLSYAQQRLWFLNQLQPDSPSYNIPLAIRFIGKLDIAAVRGSLSEIMRRHEILRTAFATQEGRPWQVIASQSAIWLPMVDLSELAEQEQNQVLALIAQQEAQRPFNLAQGPLMRTTLIRQAHEIQMLLLTMHHIVTDAWSMGVFFRELTELYRAWVNGTPSSLPELAIQYADYALWQRQWLEGPIQEQQLAYWKRQLAGTPPLLELSTDHPRPQEQSYRGARYFFVVPPELVSRLRQLGQQEGATLFMVLLTAFGGVLSRYSGQDDLVVGTPIANRRRTQLEEMIGFFVNTLALRLSLSGCPTVREMLRRVREVALGAYAHQDLPFERVVEALHPQRNLSYTPLFQVVFVLQNVATASLELPNVNVQMLAMESGIARFDLTLTMQERDQDVLGMLEYNRDLFEPGTIERMVSHLCIQLEGMVTSPEQQMAELPLLTLAERQQLLVEWNEVQTCYPHDRGLIALFEEQVQQAPAAIALVFEEQQVSYSELNARANQLAHYLRQLGVGIETLVGLCLERSIEMVVGILAILKAGGAYVPLDLSYPPERLAFILQDAQITILLTQKQLQARFSMAEVSVICLDEKWPAVVQQSQCSPQVETRPEHLAYVIYTSGSTGTPKGVLVSHRQVVRLFASTQPQFHFDQHDHWTQFHSIAFDFSVWELWGALLFGGRLVVVPFWQSREPERFLELLSRQQITVLNQTPSAFRQLVAAATAAGWPALSALRLIVFGGEALDLPSARSWFTQMGEGGPQLVNMYGITETTVHVSWQPLSLQVLDSGVPSPIGRPLSDLQVYVLDRRGQPVPVGVVGELYVGGAGVARGYLRRPELTAERFVPHPFSEQPGERLYRSGDLARYGEGGALEYLGRNDGQVKLRGFRIEPGEIEAVLQQHEAVREAVVTVQETRQGEKQLVAYVVPTVDQVPSLSALRAFLGARLPAHMLPAAFVLLEQLPLTANGKLDRQGLPAPDGTRPELDKEYRAPQSEMERTLAQIWSQVLHLQHVGVHDNFFELGGDSILSIQIVARAHAAGLALTPRQLFQHQTIAQLAAVVGSTVLVRSEAEVVEGAMPLLPIHHWFFTRHLAQPHHWNQAILLQTRQRLNPALVAQALQAIAGQHDAFRLRAQQQAESWQLSFAALADPLPFVQVDLNEVPTEQQQATLEAAATALQASLHLTDGPLLRAALFELGNGQPARLLIVSHHLAIDIVSWSIVLDDLHTAYQQLQQGEAVCLPPKTTSVQQWAQRLHDYAQTPALHVQLSYWLGQGWEQVRALPVDMAAEQEANREDTARSVVVALSVEQTQALLTEVPRAYHTQINDVLLTALVQAFARWTGATCVLLHLEGHGREDLFEEVDLSRTIGWFTCLLPLVLEIREGEGPGESLKRIKEQLRAIPQGGIGFGLLRYLCQDAAVRERLTALPPPEVSFNYAGRSAATLDEEGFFELASEAAGNRQGPQNERSHVLEINGSIVGDQLYLVWTYSARLHHHATIERLAQSYLEALEMLIRHCQSPNAGGYTPSDFPLARLDEQKLRELSLLINSADEL